MLPRLPGNRLHGAADAETTNLNDSPRFNYGSAGGAAAAAVVAQVNPAHVEATSSEPDPDTIERDSVAILTRRLRCLFSVITCPIVPLGTVVTLTLMWMQYAAFVLDAHKTCAHPLHWYALLSLVLIVYAPYHSTIRSRLCPASNADQRPLRARRFDQIFHTVALLYVYGGITIVQSCHDDKSSLQDYLTNTTSTVSESPDGGSNSSQSDAIGADNVCDATCPALFTALRIYVAALEVFTFSLILPLLLLPCLYLWFLRQATSEQEALALLQERLREEEEAFMRGNTCTTQEVLDHLQDVKLVQDEEDANRHAWVLPFDSNDVQKDGKDSKGVRECCICMNEFEVIDLEMGPTSESEASPPPISSHEAIVRTAGCGHLFHKRCIASWVGGRWQNDTDPLNDWRQRRARRTTCPLCRRDLRPLD